ncbi:hypothetical protein [Pseudobacteriovorax antillogorgiicola]|uniref:Lipoprotein n=1 Tax=Pseudobacteriovorax antillogorgiicola TaxID=1513793 RepID=A0A1Y6BSM0_9BACT|nr:hypothetical protein [Pseudobacteriovorax antillogorgiicola]TCS53071.1 hypothetical protein EDD56_108122 [Pseudobacteriovorax antillogorgiicola]SMF26272.1 hypothetical protein SAMN06296036_108125 [Pseudobacteriovorax antillogorgiicola]
MNRFLLPLTVPFLLLGCFPGEGFFEQEAANLDSIQEVGVQVVGETSVAQVFAGANVTQSIEVPEGSPLEGTSLSIPPGALNISMNITIEEAVTPATDGSLGDLGIVGADTDSIATVFSNDQNVKGFADGMAGTIQVSTGKATTGLGLVDTTPVMFSRHDKDDGSCVDTIYQLNTGDFVTLASGKEVVKFQTAYFGTYQVIRVPDLNFSTSPRQTPWGTTILAEAVPEECKIVTKTEKQVLDTQNPVSLGVLSTELNGQIFAVIAPKISETPKKCSLTLRSAVDTDGKTFQAAQSRVEVNLEGKGFPLKAEASYQCTFNDGRFLKKKVEKLPRGIRLLVDRDLRQVTIRTDLPEGGACKIDAYHVDDKTDTHEEAITNYNNYLLDFNEDSEDTDYYIRVSCTYPTGLVLRTPYARFDLGTCDTCKNEDEGGDQNTTNPNDTIPPTVNSFTWATSIMSPGEANIVVDGYDDQGDLRRICFAMTKDTGGMTAPVGCFDLMPIGGNQYQATIQLPDYYVPYTYDISWIDVEDYSGNRRWFNSMFGDTYYREGYDLVNGVHQEQGISTMPVFNWNVNAGPGNNPDTMAPTLLSFGNIASTLGLPGELVIPFSISDSGGSLVPNMPAPVCLTIENLVTGQQSNRCPHTEYIAAGQYEAYVHLDNQYENGDYGIKQFLVGDLAGNQATYSAASMPGNYSEAPGINVPVVTLTGGADYSPPFIDQPNAVFMDLATYDVGGGSVMATITVEATDPSGLANICVVIDQEFGMYEHHTGCHVPVDNGDGTFSATFTLADYFQNAPQNYVPARIELFDTVGNRTEMYKMSGGDTYYTINGNISAVLIPTFDFINATPDGTAPVINSLSFNNTNYTVPNSAILTMNITDSGAGLDFGNVCVRLETAAYIKMIYHCGIAQAVGGDNYTLDVPLNPWIENGTYKLLDVSVYDMAGNYTNLYASFGDAQYMSSPLAVLSFNIAGASTDTLAPTLTANAAYFDRSSYNPGDYAYLFIEITDDISGFMPFQNNPCWRLTNAGYSEWIYICGSLSNEGGNLWKFGFMIPFGQLYDTYFLESIDLTDQAENMTNYYSSSAAGPYSPDPGWAPPTLIVNP